MTNWSPRKPRQDGERGPYEVFKNKGELALYCEHLQTVKYRNPEAFAEFVEKR
jgi:hypothetical protein